MITPIASDAVRSLVKRLPFAVEPLSLFRRMTDDGRQDDVVLLESAEPSSRATQKSLLILSSALAIECRGGSVTIVAKNANGVGVLPRLAARFSSNLLDAAPDRISLEIPRKRADGDERERLAQYSVLSVLRDIRASFRPETANLPESIFLTGVFAYDLVAQFEELPAVDGEGEGDFPDYRFLLADTLVIVDHLKQQTEILVNVFGGERAEERYYSALGTVAGLHETILSVQRCGNESKSASDIVIDTGGAHVDIDDHRFSTQVEGLKRHILAGDVFQIVPSRTFSLPCSSPLAAYERLRLLNPSPYLFFFNTGNFTLFGASPESAVKVDGNSGRLEISPIAGTRPRGLRADGSIDQDLDGRYEAELRLDEKEIAEHMMLVDLARNDVARVSKPGTRHVADLLRVIRYSHVMHLVSQVRGELADGLDALHAYQASMNMGTLTGAPKIRAMQLLRIHESSPRGHYGGAIGYLAADGSLDTAIVIRAALVRDGVAYVRAGAGVVHDSVPLAEAEETRRKAEAVLKAIAYANAAARAMAMGQAKEPADVC